MLKPAILLLALLAAAPAAADCDFGAYSNDPDPAGTNVRSGPASSYPVIGVLHVTEQGGDLFAPEFTVTGFRDGWVNIGDAVTGQYGDGPEETVFHGPGWVHASLIGFDIEDPVLRQAPSLDAPAIRHLEGDWSLDTLSIETIHACDGGFIELTLRNGTGETVTGWATDLCGNQVTTCS